MSNRVYTVVAILILICMVGFIAAQLCGTKAVGAAASPAEKEAKKPTLEERVEALKKNQDKMLTELKEIKQNQEEILQMTNKIFIYMKRR